MDDAGLGTAALRREGGAGLAALGPMALESGQALSAVELAYRTYGRLDADASNAILVHHALTGDQHVASPHPQTGRPGWWPRMVGPGAPVDTDRFFVVCANVLGGCAGSTGPARRFRPWWTGTPSCLRSAMPSSWDRRSVFARYDEVGIVASDQQLTETRVAA